MSWSTRTMSRRTAVTAFGVALLSACSSAGESPAQPSQRPSGEPTGSPPAMALPEPTPYEILPGEVEPRCKDAAVHAVTAALTWRPGERAYDLQSRLTRAGAGPLLAADLETLIDNHLASTVEVVYPQYAGLDDGRKDASVMLVGRQTWRTAAGAEPQTAT